MEKSEKDGLICMLSETISNGDTDTSSETIRKMTESGEDPRDFTRELADRTIELLSEKFSDGRIYLPTLVKISEHLNEMIESVYGPDDTSRKTVIMGTAMGDIHEIGKNLCAATLRCRGYRVINLGCDVEPMHFIKTAKNNNAPVIAVSTLMTSTRAAQKIVVDLVKENTEKIYVLIGGAVCTEEWSNCIGADGYSGDWKEFIELVKKIIGD